MSYVITDLCAGVCDGACVRVCPVDCIHGPAPLEELRANRLQLYIDPEACISCGLCALECPVEAIHDEDEIPDAALSAVTANAAFFTERRGR